MSVRKLSPWLLVAALALVALVLLGHDTRSQGLAGSAPHLIAGQTTTRETCGRRRGCLLMAGTKSAQGTTVGMISVAAGAVDGYGYKWDLRAKVGENGFDAVEDGRLVVDGRTFGMCGGAANPAEFALVLLGTHGMVYGYLANPGRWQIAFRSVREGGVGEFYPLYTRRVLGGTFFISQVPQLVCGYKSLTLVASHGAKAAGSHGSQDDTHYRHLVACQLNQTSITRGHGGRGSVSPSAGTPHVVAAIALRAATASIHGAGIAEEIDQHGRLLITVIAHGITPNANHDSYAIWLYKPPAMRRLLGFVTPGVRANGRLRTTGVLPENARSYDEILITLESDSHPRAPSRVVLIGRGSFK